MVSRSDVVSAYNLLLDREPDNEHVIEHWMKNASSIADLYRGFTQTEEYISRENRTARSTFWNFHATFDPEALIRRHAARNVTPSPHHYTNFLGVRVRREVYPPVLDERMGRVEGLPLPSAWHADMAEWGSCLRALEASGEHFTMLELGCGWGCWMNNMGVAAKAMGKTVKLYGVEALSDHIQMARRALADNEITREEYRLVLGIAGKKSSGALFPLVESGINWGGEAVFNPSPAEIASYTKAGEYTLISVVDLGDLLSQTSVLDLLHVDIQGAELGLMTEVLPILVDKVRYIFIGTHSRSIEGGLIDLFSSDGRWVMEMERGVILDLSSGLPVVVGDGVQLWRNTTVP